MEQLCNYGIIASLACEENKEVAFKSFSRQYTEACFKPFENDPWKVWTAVKLAYQASEDIRSHELNMDNKFFDFFCSMEGIW
jgi:hypothetical protein